MPAPVLQCAAREPTLLGHPPLEVVEQRGVRSRAGRLRLETPQEEDPSSRDTEKLSAVLARVVADTCLTADHFDASRRCFKALLIHVQAAVRVQVTGRGHHDPGDPTERHLAEALLAAVLEESFTLDRVRRDRVEHEVRRLHEQLLEPPSLTECRPRVADLCGVGKERDRRRAADAAATPHNYSRNITAFMLGRT